MKKKNNKKDQIFCIGVLSVFVIVVLGFPIIISKLNISKNWVSFLGNYIGGILTGGLVIIGAWIAVLCYEQQNDKNAARAVKPALNVWHLNGSLGNADDVIRTMRHFDYVLGYNGFTKWINFAQREKNFCIFEWMIVDIIIQNIGDGAVMHLETDLEVCGDIKGTGRDQTISIPKGESIAYRVYIRKNVPIKDKNELIFRYTDIYGSETFEQRLKFEVMENTGDFANMEDITMPRPIRKKTKKE